MTRNGRFRLRAPRAAGYGAAIAIALPLFIIINIAPGQSSSGDYGAWDRGASAASRQAAPPTRASIGGQWSRGLPQYWDPVQQKWTHGYGLGARYRHYVLLDPREAGPAGGEVLAMVPTEPADLSILGGTVDQIQFMPGDNGADHTIVSLRLQDGREVLADLGPNADVDDLGLQPGDRLLLSGRPTIINGKRAVAASTLMIDDQLMQLDRDVPHRRAAVTQQFTSTGYLEGIVEHVAIESMQPGPDAHTLVRIRLADGATVLTDLGPDLQPHEGALQRGDLIAIRGRMGSFGELPVVVADHAQIGGQSYALRPQMREIPGELPRTGAPFEGQQPLGYVEPAMDASMIVNDWPNVSRDIAREMIERYGQPDEIVSSMLIWRNQGPWRRIVVHREPVRQQFPQPHSGVLEQSVAINVPADRADDLARFNENLIVDRARGELIARGDSEAANILALNLAQEVIAGEREVNEAGDAYIEQFEALLRGELSDDAQWLDAPTGRSLEPEQPMNWQ